MSPVAPRSPLLPFFVLAFALDIPFLVLGALVPAPAGLPLQLPLSSLGVVCPFLAATALVGHQAGRPAMRGLLRRVVELRPPHWAWYLAAVAIMPLVAWAGAALTGLLGAPSGLTPSPAAIPVLLVVFFVAAALEEVGWTGYATDRLRQRFGTPRASLLLGVIWAGFHLIPWFQVHGTLWTAGQALATVVFRVVMVQLYVRTRRSLLAPILFHDLINVSTSFVATYAWAWTPWVVGAVALVPAVLLVVMARRLPRRGRLGRSLGGRLLSPPLRG